MPKLPKHSLLAGLIALSLLAACARSAEENQKETEPLTVDAVTAAFVNNRPIYQEDVELEAAAQGVISPGEPFIPSHAQYDEILDQLIDQKLLAQEAERRGLPDDPAAKRRLLTARERILGNILVETLVASDVTEAKVLEMYQEQTALQQLDDEVRLSQIIVETEEEAQRVYDDLLDGAEFAVLARDRSIDQATRLEGGSLGYVSPNNFDGPYAAAIANTDTRGYSEPFSTLNGWVVLYIEDRRTEAPLTLDQMRPEIVTFLTYSEISRILRDLRAESVIEKGMRDPSGQTAAAENGDTL